jgi:hypothetical protein
VVNLLMRLQEYGAIPHCSSRLNQAERDAMNTAVQAECANRSYDHVNQSGREMVTISRENVERVGRKSADAPMKPFVAVGLKPRLNPHTYLIKEGREASEHSRTTLRQPEQAMFDVGAEADKYTYQVITTAALARIQQKRMCRAFFLLTRPE